MKRRPVEVEWTDSVGAGGWFTPDDWGEFAHRPVSTCFSVGYVVRKNAKHVVLAQSINGTNRGSLLSIPLRMVKRIRPL